MWRVLNAFGARMVLSFLVRIGKTNCQTWKQMSFSRPYVTRKPTQAKDVWGKLASSTVSTAMRHTKYDQDYYRTFKAGSTERCQIQLATALLSWYSIVLGLTCLNSSFRKGLNKNHGREPAGNGSKSRLQDEGEGRETKHKGKKWSSKWQPQVGKLVVAQCQVHVVSDAEDHITKKYFRPHDGPWKVTRVKPPSTYEVANEQSKMRKIF